jgi:hypothetical protein
MLNGPGGFSGDEAAELRRRDGVVGSDERAVALFRCTMVVREREASRR